MILPKVVINALIKTKLLFSYAFIWAIITIIELTQQTMMASLLTTKAEKNEEESDNTVTIALMIIIVPIIRYGLFGDYLNKISEHIKLSIWGDILTEYNELTLESKNVFATSDLERKMFDSEWALVFWIEMGFPTIIHLVNMIYFCTYTFYLSDTLYLLFALVAGMIVLYFGLKRSLDNKMAKVWTSNRTKREKNSQLLKLEFPRFAYGSRSVVDIMKLINERCSIEIEYNKMRSQQKMLSWLITEVGVASIILLTTAGTSTGVLAVTMKFTAAVNGLFGLLNMNTHFEGIYASLRKDFDKAKKQTIKPTKEVFNEPITVQNCYIKKGTFTLKLHEQFTYSCGCVFGFIGPSGAGKTTFIKAVFVGDDDAKVKLSTNKLPQNYFHLVSWLYQEIRGNMKVNKLTVSEVFNHSRDKKLINKCVQIAKVGKPIERLKDKVKELKKSWIDIEISEIGAMSGGEMTRFAISRQIYEVFEKNLKFLILDEPEQGTDPPVAYQMIHDIVSELRSKCVIVIISHLEKYGLDSDGGNIDWTKRFYVNNGIVKSI